MDKLTILQNLEQSEHFIVPLHRSTVTCLDVDPSGLYLATGGLDSLIVIWNLTDDSDCFILSSNTDSVWCLQYTSPTTIISGFSKGLIAVWDLSTRSILISATQPESLTCFSTNLDSQIWSASETGKIYAWEIAGLSLLTSFQAHSYYVSSLSFSENKELVASGSPDYSVKLWNSDSYTLYYSFTETRHQVSKVLFFSKYLISGSNDGSVFISDVNEKNTIRFCKKTKGVYNIVYLQKIDEIILGLCCGKFNKIKSENWMEGFITMDKTRCSGCRNIHCFTVKENALDDNLRTLFVGGINGLVEVLSYSNEEIREIKNYGTAMNISEVRFCDEQKVCMLVIKKIGVFRYKVRERKYLKICALSGSKKVSSLGFSKSKYYSVVSINKCISRVFKIND